MSWFHLQPLPVAATADAVASCRAYDSKAGRCSFLRLPACMVARMYTHSSAFSQNIPLCLTGSHPGGSDVFCACCCSRTRCPSQLPCCPCKCMAPAVQTPPHLVPPQRLKSAARVLQQQDPAPRLDHSGHLPQGLHRVGVDAQAERVHYAVKAGGGVIKGLHRACRMA